ncbi:MAG: hypothetical protein NZ874_02120 [Fimbriimonadales bacterium]|nr:hypothetical protein [Fimbriimonadales bacterium]
MRYVRWLIGLLIIALLGAFFYRLATADDVGRTIMLADGTRVYVGGITCDIHRPPDRGDWWNRLLEWLRLRPPGLRVSAFETQGNVLWLRLTPAQANLKQVYRLEGVDSSGRPFVTEAPFRLHEGWTAQLIPYLGNPSGVITFKLYALGKSDRLVGAFRVRASRLREKPVPPAPVRPLPLRVSLGDAVMEIIGYEAQLDNPFYAPHQMQYPALLMPRVRFLRDGKETDEFHVEQILYETPNGLSHYPATPPSPYYPYWYLKLHIHRRTPANDVLKHAVRTRPFSTKPAAMTPIQQSIRLASTDILCFADAGKVSGAVRAASLLRVPFAYQPTRFSETPEFSLVSTDAGQIRALEVECEAPFLLYAIPAQWAAGRVREADGVRVAEQRRPTPYLIVNERVVPFRYYWHTQLNFNPGMSLGVALLGTPLPEWSSAQIGVRQDTIYEVRVPVPPPPPELVWQVVQKAWDF